MGFGGNGKIGGTEKGYGTKHCDAGSVVLVVECDVPATEMLHLGLFRSCCRTSRG